MTEALGRGAAFTAMDGPHRSLEMITDPFYAVDREWRIVYANPPAEEAFGRRLEEVAGQVLWDCFPAARHPLYSDKLHEAARDRRSVSFDILSPSLSRWVEVRCLPWDDGVAVYLKDVHARHLAEESLRLHSRVLESMTEGVSVSDEDGLIVYTNPAEDRMFGYDRGELVGQSVAVQNAYPPEENQRLVGSVIEQLRTVGVWQGEWHNRRKDGSTFYTQAHISALKEGDRFLWVCVQRDVTEQKKQTQALHAAQRQLSLLVESIGDHLVSYDTQWRYTFVNDGAASLLGKPKEELLGRSIWELFPEAVGNQYWHELHRAAADGVPIISEHHYAAWDRWFENRIYPTAEGVTVFATDITARKRIEQALAEREKGLMLADQRKDEFLATLAHELRNPLAPIRQAVHVARSPQASEAQVRWSHEVVERQVRHMARLLDDLLDVSRVSRGTMQLRREPVEVQAIVDAAIETARPLIDARQHELVVHNDCAAVRIHADANRMSQLVSNLLSNAAKYTDAGGRIELDVRRDELGLVMRVKDTGIGIASDDLDSVFGMFSQVNAAIDRAEGGLGIGLALAKGIVELHGGAISVHSGGLGHGSEFIVRLPNGLILSSPPAQPGPSADTAPRPMRIVLADDNDDAAETLALLLTLEGHAVHKAGDGVQALELATRHHPDVLILDIGMPRMNGLEAAAAVRRQPWARDAWLLALTGWGQEQDKQRAFEAGFDEHMTKPVDPQALRQMLWRFATRRGESERLAQG